MAHEGLFLAEDSTNLTNVAQPAIAAGLGCLMGSFSVPGVQSIGERLLTANNGAVGFVGASAMVDNRSGVEVGRSLLEETWSGLAQRLGDAWLSVEAGVIRGNPMARAYHFLGDAALALGGANAPRSGPIVRPTRPPYAEWVSWAFAPVWHDWGWATAPEMDPDKDGLRNKDEYISGSDPGDEDSAFILVSVSEVDGACRLSWPSAPGRRYTIEAATDLSGDYRVIAEGLEATPPYNTWVDVSSAGGSVFYRVRVE